MDRRTLRRRLRGTRLSADSRQSFTQQVLARTSGTACASARELLGVRFDAPHDSETAALLDGHLAHCQTCAALAVALDDIAAALPGLAELEPGETFAAGVCRATSGRRHTRRAVAGRRLASDRASWWMRLVCRPRVSFELAYVGTALWVLLAGSPVVLADAVAAGAKAVVASTSTRVIRSVDRLNEAPRATGGVYALDGWVDTLRTELSDARAATATWADAWAAHALDVQDGAQAWLTGIVQRVRALVATPS